MDFSGMDLKALTSPLTPSQRKSFIGHLCGASVFLFLSIWINAAWIYGSLFEMSHRAQHLNILVADFDGGAIGQVLLEATSSLSGAADIVTFDVVEGVDMDWLYDKVWHGQYWGAFMAILNATERLDAAVTAGNTSYDPSGALYFIWNEVRWALAQETFVEASVETTLGIMKQLFATQYTAELMSQSPQLSKNASLVLLNSFQISSTNIYSFPIGIKPFISTVGFVFPGLIQFFFAMAFGGISAKSHIHVKYSTRWNYMVRFIVSRLWTFIIALSWAGWFFCFAEGRTGQAHSFILIALDIWMYTMISFEFHDTCAAFVPIEFLPITVLSWVIMNVTAAAFPIPLKPAFYHFDYAVPSYNCFELLITILSGGSTNRVYRNVPILFAWMMITGLTGIAANMRRCRLARAKLAAVEDMSSPSANHSEEHHDLDELTREKTVEGEFTREALGDE